MLGMKAGASVGYSSPPVCPVVAWAGGWRIGIGIIGIMGIIGSLLISAPKRTIRRDMLFMKMEQKVAAHKRFYASDAVGVFIVNDMQRETK